MQIITEGARIELADYVDRFPFFQAEPGATGTISIDTDVTGHTVVLLKMDEQIPGCEEWDNIIYFRLPEDEEELQTVVRLASS
jgi:hypothetical protein